MTAGALAVLWVLGAATVVSARAAFRARRRAGVAARLAGDAEKPSPARRRTPVALLAACAGASLAAVLAPPLAPVGAAAGASAPRALRRWRSARELARLEAQLPEALAAVASSLRSGTSLPLAVGEAGAALPAPLGPELRRVAVTAAAVGLTRALDELVARRPLPTIRLATAALALGHETGGPMARGIDGVAATLRQRLAVQGEAAALATQARLSGWVIALAPVLFAGMLSATDPAASRWLLRTPAGLVVLLVGLLLDLAGAAWMARLTRRVR